LPGFRQFAPCVLISRTSAMQSRARGNRACDWERTKRRCGHRRLGAAIGRQDSCHCSVDSGRSDEHLWSGTYDREVQTCWCCQSDVTKALRITLRSRLLAGKEAHRAPRTVAPRFYEAYLKGRFALHKNTQVGFKEAIAHFQEAINREERPSLRPTRAWRPPQ